MKLFANIISYLLHPLLMPTLGILIIFNSGTFLSFFLPPYYERMLYILVLLSTFVLPLIIIPILFYWKQIKSLEMHNKNERFFPMLTTLIFNIVTFYLFTKLPLPSTVRLYMLAVTICVLLALLITIRWKISSHMIGIGGITGLIAALSFLYLGDLQIYLMIAILLAGLIGFARLHLNVHTPSQIYAGFFLGFFVEFITLVVFATKMPLH